MQQPEDIGGGEELCHRCMIRQNYGRDKLCVTCRVRQYTARLKALYAAGDTACRREGCNELRMPSSPACKACVYEGRGSRPHLRRSATSGM